MEDPYANVKSHFAEVPGVEVNSGRGSQGMKVGKKMFAMFYKGDLLVQLPPGRVDELISSGTGLAFDPGTGKPMKNRVLIPAARGDRWIELCDESRKYVAGK